MAERLDIGDFFEEIDPHLLKYASAFQKCGFSSSVTMKYWREQDFQNLGVEVPEGHRRLILNMVMQSPKLLNSDFISFREVDPLLQTIINNNMESLNDSLLGVLMCFLESGSMLPVLQYCLVYLWTVERFIRYLLHISLIVRIAAI